jgi:hypothetical protein
VATHDRELSTFMFGVVRHINGSELNITEAKEMMPRSSEVNEFTTAHAQNTVAKANTATKYRL